MSIQTYEPGHGGMYPISSGNGQYVKAADHERVVKNLREALTDALLLLMEWQDPSQQGLIGVDAAYRWPQILAQARKVLEETK